MSDEPLSKLPASKALSSKKPVKQFDRDHLWHPYSSLVAPQDMLVVESAKGCTLTLDNGTELIDGMASWWAAIQGYNHPELNQALTDQIPQFSHVMFGGLTHKPAVDLGKKILEIVSPNLGAIFYSDSGSVAVEVGLKMALQYWQGIGRPEKTKIITFKRGYHGDTFATMALSDRENGMHARFGDILYEPIYLERPPSGYDDPVPQTYVDHLRDIVSAHSEQSAAIVVEPIVQNAGGMNIYNPQILRQLRELCNEFDLLLILDEIATGFGRTGKWFGYEHADIEADVLCIGKAMTAGYLSFAATLTSRKIAEGISGAASDPLMHGPTYMGNALAARVAAKNIEILQRGDWKAQISQIEQILKTQLAACLELDGVKDVRILGGVGVVELDQAIDINKTRPVFVEEGVWLRPFRNLIYCMPPYVISEQELKKICAAIYKVIELQSY